MSSSDSSSGSGSSSDSDSSSDSGSVHEHPEAAPHDTELDIYNLQEAADETYDKNVGLPLKLWKDAMRETGEEVSACKRLLKSRDPKTDLAFSRAAALYEGLYDAEVLGLCVPMLGSGLQAFREYLKTARAYLRRQLNAKDKKSLQLLTEKLRMYEEQSKTSLEEFRQQRNENQQKVATMKENRNRLIYEQLVLSMNRSTKRLDVERSVLEHVTHKYWLDFTSKDALDDMKAVLESVTNGYWRDFSSKNVLHEMNTLAQRAPPRGARAPSDGPAAKR